MSKANQIRLSNILFYLGVSTFIALGVYLAGSHDVYLASILGFGLPLLFCKKCREGNSKYK